MHHFFVNMDQIDELNNEIHIIGDDRNHIQNVLRIKANEEISISNGVDSKEYRCEIKELLPDEILLTIRFIKESNVELPSKIYLFQGLPKSDKMELIIQKTCELGIYEIIPVEMKRCIVKLDKKKMESKIKRWQTIATTAAKQSQRNIIPEVKEVVTFKQAIEMVKELDVKLLPYELASDMQATRDIFTKIEKGQSIAIFIGPEGGFSEEEIEIAKSENITPITLGKRILRTETAGIATLAMLMYEIEGR